MIVLVSEPLQHCLLMSTKENIKKKKGHLENSSHKNQNKEMRY